MSEIVLWIPTGSARPESWLQIEGLLNTRIPDGYTMRFYRTRPSVDPMKTWNDAVENFLASGAEWLWSVHDDVVVHPLALERLLSWNEPLISGLVFTKENPAFPHIWKLNDEGRHTQPVDEIKEWFMAREEDIRPGAQVLYPRPADALTPVSFTSTSCSLIHREVFEKLGGDWFAMDERGGGEDRRFFAKAMVRGFTPYVDRSCICGHLGLWPSGVMDFILWQGHPLFNATCEDKI